MDIYILYVQLEDVTLQISIRLRQIALPAVYIHSLPSDGISKKWTIVDVCAGTINILHFKHYFRLYYYIFINT